MKEKIEKLLDELRKEKTSYDKAAKDAWECRFTDNVLIFDSKAKVFSFCIEKLEKIINE